MEAIELGAAAAVSPCRPSPGWVPLIESLGTKAFPARLFAFSHALTRTSHLTAFVYPRADASPRVLMAENVGATCDSRHIADLYMRRFWQHDLANGVCSSAGKAAGLIVRTKAAEIDDGDYKYNCYTSARLSARTSVLIGCDGAFTRLNYYAASGRDFSEGDMDNIARWSELFIGLLLKHHSMMDASRPKDGSDYDAALGRLAVALPPRERQVCAGILEGLSSEAIALRLEVSINTVRTFRKRAYARLEISSQNELMRLVTQGQCRLARSDQEALPVSAHRA